MRSFFRMSGPNLNQDRKWAIGISVLVHLIFAVFLTVLSWTIPMPPPPEQGMLINFGNQADGQGNTEPTPQEKQVLRASAAPPTQKQLLTQDFEEAAALKTQKPQKKTVRKPSPPAPTPTTAAPTPEPARQVNQRALFSGKGEQSSAGEGTGTSPGNQGSKDGAANAPHGSGGGSGSGGGNFSLAGRSIVGSLPKPQYTTNNAGMVVVEIIVDRSGNVIKATALVQGSTVQDDALFKAAEKAAYRAKFTTSENAAGIQRGTITYHFRIQN